MDQLNFQHLLYLKALVEERHVTRAAERMGIGQPGMSTALARLRHLFKDVLLVKTSTGMEPTPRALELVRRVRGVADLLEGRGQSDESFDPGTSQLRWRILASDGIARAVLPDLMSATNEVAPHMRFTVQPADVRRLSEYLRDGDFDLALAFVSTPPSELRQTMLYPQRPVCIAREGHPNIADALTLQQFADQLHVRWGTPPVAYSSMEAMVDEAMQELGHARKFAVHVSSVGLLPGIVSRSNLLAVVAEQVAWTARETLPIQVLPLPFRLPNVNVSLLWHERLHRDSGHKWLRDTLQGIGHDIAKQASARDSSSIGIKASGRFFQCEFQFQVADAHPQPAPTT